MEKIVLSVKEVADALDIGINQAYKLVRTKDFPSLRVGQKYLVPKDDFMEWIKAQTNGTRI